MAKDTLIGTWVHRDLADLFALCCVFRKTSKSQILTEQIEKVIKECPPPFEMIEAIAQETFAEWENEPLSMKKVRKVSWAEYIDNVKRKWAGKLAPEIITSIITRMNVLRRERASDGTQK